MQLDRLLHIERLISLYESGQLPEVGGRTMAETGHDATAIASAENGQSALTASTPPAEDAPPDPDKMPVDSNQVRVDAVSALLSKDRRLRVSMDLYNESGRQIAGTLSFFLLTVDEARTPLPHSDAAFRISRLKKFASIITIPDAVGDLTNAALIVEVVSSDKTLLFRQLYPIAE
jgi:hypothetical protein